MMTEENIQVPEHHLVITDNEIVITLIAPLSKPDEANFLIDREFITFISNPYFVKLKLPYSVFEILDDLDFNSVTSTYVVKLKKLGSNHESFKKDFTDVITCQNISDMKETAYISCNDKDIQYYGFANKYSKIFGKLSEAFSEVVSLPNPDSISAELKKALQSQEENDKWNDDHYLADTMETDHLDSIFHYKQPWIVSPITELSESMMILLKSCKSFRNSDLTAQCQKIADYQLVNILFAYSYDKRINEGDSSVESGWTINKLSSTLCWFEVFDDLKSVLLSCYRRSLIFPLYRNWHLAELVHKDVATLIGKGSAQVTHSLLEIKDLFNESDNRYLLNMLFIDNLSWYAYYYMSNESFKILSKDISEVKIAKYEVNSDLPLLEIAAHLTLKEETEGRKLEENILNIVKEVEKLTLKKEKDISSGDNSSDSYSSLSSSDDLSDNA